MTNSRLDKLSLDDTILFAINSGAPQLDTLWDKLWFNVVAKLSQLLEH